MESRAYSKIEQRIKTGAYKTNRTQKKENKHYLLTTRSRLLSRKSNNVKYKTGRKRKIEKLDLLLERLSDQELESPDSGEVWINKTLEQGDCFFSSLFRAFKERDLLSTVTHSLPDLRSSTEVRFISSFRKLIAKEILENRLPFTINERKTREDAYDFYAGMGESLGAAIAYDEVLPDWFKKAFVNGIKSRKHFLSVCAKAVRKRKEYVGQLEVEITKRLLAEIGIILEIEGMRRSLLPKMKDGLPLIVLFNEFGGHYEYFSFGKRCTRKNTVRNEISRKCHPKCKENEDRYPPDFFCDCMPGFERHPTSRACVPACKKGEVRLPPTYECSKKGAK
jgi:hypothetical protein